MISDLLKGLDISQAISPNHIGTSNRDLQIIKQPTTKGGRPKKYVSNEQRQSNETSKGQGQSTSKREDSNEGQTKREVQPSISQEQLDLVEELKRRNTLQKKHRAEVEQAVKVKIIWQPHPGPQTDFLSSTEYEVGFFGGRNSGKSDCLLVDPLRFVDNENFKGLLIRKTMPALREIISRAKKLYPKIKPGTKWKEAEKLFEFPSGATLEFGYYDHMDDYDRYHGREFSWLGIDEITQWKSQEYYDKIKSVVRSTDPELTPRIRCTCNPSGQGRVWVKEYFEIDRQHKSKSINTSYEILGVKYTISKKYIIATVFDNPSTVENDPQYIVYLQSLPPAIRKQWLDGDFEAVEGMAFDEFDTNIHVIEPFQIPHNWLRVRGIDWGFRGTAICMWIAFDPEGSAYIYREYVTSGVHSDTFAKNVLELERNEHVSYGVLDGQAGVQSGINGPTIEEDFINQGLMSQHADKKSGSRIHGKQLIHKYLRVDEYLGKPRLQIFNNCKRIVSELSSL